MIQKIPLYVHALDDDGKALVERALHLFHSSQEIIRLEPSGLRSLPETRKRVDSTRVYSGRRSDEPSITVTGMPLSDNWFSHTTGQRALVTVSGWQVAFLYDRGNASIGAPDASLLTSLVLSSLLILSSLDDEEILHEETVGCLFDLCLDKPDRAIKIRSAYICQPCTEILARHGLSSVQIDAARAVLECARALVLGRKPQVSKPALVPDDDLEFIHSATLPTGTSLPPRLVEACRNKHLTVLVGSGMSLQNDVKVQYPQMLGWNQLPSWAEVSGRLSECVRRYCGRVIEPRNPSSLAEYLADLDYYRSVLGESLYYPRAIFDIFSPHVLQPGRANRLIFRMPVRWTLSSNYDFVLQYAAPAGTPVFTWKESVQAREYLEAGRAQRPLLKLHGCASRPDTVILTTVEYERLRQSSEYLSLLRSVFDSQVILFIGFGLTDPFDLDIALQESRYAGAAEGEKFALLPRARCNEVQRRFAQIQVIPYDDHAQLSNVLAALIRTSSEHSDLP